MDVQKIPKRPLFTFFGTMRLTGNFKKNLVSQFLVFSELLLSPVVEKVVFESYWALDMAPTWAVPGLFFVDTSLLPTRSDGNSNHQLDQV